ncbi:hypothetical protein JCM10213_001255 [Rhodosporidiobolus nylandii]
MPSIRTLFASAASALRTSKVSLTVVSRRVAQARPPRRRSSTPAFLVVNGDAEDPFAPISPAQRTLFPSSAFRPVEWTRDGDTGEPPVFFPNPWSPLCEEPDTPEEPDAPEWSDLPPPHLHLGRGTSELKRKRAAKEKWQ